MEHSKLALVNPPALAEIPNTRPMAIRIAADHDHFQPAKMQQRLNAQIPPGIVPIAPPKAWLRRDSFAATTTYGLSLNAPMKASAVQDSGRPGRVMIP